MFFLKSLKNFSFLSMLVNLEISENGIFKKIKKQDKTRQKKVKTVKWKVPKKKKKKKNDRSRI